VSDEIDDAQELDQQFQAGALRRFKLQQYAGSASPWKKGDAARDCGDCGDPIPLDRLIVFPRAERCVPCQVLRDGRSL
jgi:phage/conjugal plasmid C-4 type zinc finger TraR family protein